jgi:hypothetical protein
VARGLEIFPQRFSPGDRHHLRPLEEMPAVSRAADRIAPPQGWALPLRLYPTVSRRPRFVPEVGSLVEVSALTPQGRLLQSTSRPHTDRDRDPSACAASEWISALHFRVPVERLSSPGLGRGRTAALELHCLFATCAFPLKSRRRGGIRASSAPLATTSGRRGSSIASFRPRRRSGSACPSEPCTTGRTGSPCRRLGAGGRSSASWGTTPANRGSPFGGRGQFEATGGKDPRP